MHVPVSTSKKTKITNRRKQVAQLYLNKVEQLDIAAKLDVSQATISNDLKALNKEWMEDAKGDIAQIKARELAELDFMELDAAALVQKLKKENDYKQALKYSEHRLNIKKMRADLLGLDNPKKVELDANMKHDIKRPEEMTDEELDKEINGDLDKLLKAGLIPGASKV